MRPLCAGWCGHGCNAGRALRIGALLEGALIARHEGELARTDDEAHQALKLSKCWLPSSYQTLRQIESLMVQLVYL